MLIWCWNQASGTLSVLSACTMQGRRWVWDLCTQKHEGAGSSGPSHGPFCLCWQWRQAGDFRGHSMTPSRDVFPKQASRGQEVCRAGSEGLVSTAAPG